MEKIDKSRRNFFAAFIHAGLDAPEHWARTKKQTVSPPGSGGYDRLRDICTSCGRCVEACSAGVLKMTVDGYGIAGVMRPAMDFSAGFCGYECTACMEACPSGALENIGLDAKQSEQIGMAELELKKCINFAGESHPCTVCKDRCPAGAIKIICGRPVVEAELCIGCGACEFFCPVSPYKAIRVEGYDVHK